MENCGSSPYSMQKYATRGTDNMGPTLPRSGPPPQDGPAQSRVGVAKYNAEAFSGRRGSSEYKMIGHALADALARHRDARVVSRRGGPEQAKRSAQAWRVRTRERRS